MSDETWAVMDSNGLTLLVNLTESQAKEIASTGKFPPGGDDPGVCHAVPRHVADEALRNWNRLREEYDRRLRQARFEAVSALLAYEAETRALDEAAAELGIELPPRCSCEWEDDGDGESGPRPQIVELDDACGVHGRAARPEEWAGRFEEMEREWAPIAKQMDGYSGFAR